MSILILANSENEAFAAILSERLEADFAPIKQHKFPDGETYIRIDVPVAGRAVAIVSTLVEPDEKILPLIFAAATARELGAASVGLIAPYLSYMRQDRRFQDGEAITSAYFAEILNRWADWLVTIDPHLHRHASLEEIYSISCEAVHAAPLISSWIEDEVENPLLIGPDSESEQWVAAVAKAAGAPHIVLEKVRMGDRSVQVSAPEVDLWRDRTPVLVDDIISTARTMIETVQHLKNAGLNPPVCVGVHGIFAADAFDELCAQGVERIVTTNTVPHPSNGIDISGLMAAAISHRKFGAE